MESSATASRNPNPQKNTGHNEFNVVVWHSFYALRNACMQLR